MAPEVVKCPLKAHPDDNKMDTRFHYNAVVDTWAVGCMAYELIAGTPPFMAETQQEVVNNINHKQVRESGSLLLLLLLLLFFLLLLSLLLLLIHPAWPLVDG